MELIPTLRARISELYDIGWGYKRTYTQYPDKPTFSRHMVTIKRDKACAGIISKYSPKYLLYTLSTSDTLHIMLNKLLRWTIKCLYRLNTFTTLN
jgi:hypothetical protein